jgi:hypothetical protein
MSMSMAVAELSALCMAKILCITPRWNSKSHLM